MYPSIKQVPYTAACPENYCLCRYTGIRAEFIIIDMLAPSKVEALRAGISSNFKLCTANVILGNAEALRAATPS
jgi:hypothetical protein